MKRSTYANDKSTRHDCSCDVKRSTYANDKSHKHDCSCDDTKSKGYSSKKGDASICDDDAKKIPPPVVKKTPPHKTVDPHHDKVIVCTTIRSKPWHKIGDRGRRTPFFDTGKTYKQIMYLGLRGKNPHNRLGREYLHARLHMARGATYGKRIQRTVTWAEKHFTSYGVKSAKRETHAKATKRIRRAVINKHRVLVKFNKRASQRCHYA